MKMMLF